MELLRNPIRNRDLVTWWVLAAGPLIAVGIQTPRVGEAALRWGWLAFAIPLVVVLATTHIPRIGVRFIGWWAGWLIWAGISLGRSPDQSAGLWLIAAVATAALAFLWGIATEPPAGSSIRYLGAGSLVLLFLALVARGYPGSVGNLNPDRILAMALVVPMVVSWKPPVSRLWVAATGLGAVGIGILSGSRTASVALLILVLAAPGLRLPKAGRLLAVGLSVVLLVGAAGSNAFQERWLLTDRGSATEVLSVENLNTSGRREGWSAIISQCHSPILGDGVGASARYGSEFAQGFPEPHNEALRIWCDTGAVGLVLFWGFVVTVGWAALGALPKGRKSESWALLAALQLLAGFVLVSLTDNPVTTAALLPAVAMVWGWSSAGARSRPIS